MPHSCRFPLLRLAAPGMLCVLLAVAAPGRAAEPPFDHAHAAWDALLARHVHLAPDAASSRVDYRGFAADRPALRAYLDTLSRVDPRDYARWTKAQQFAFLANAYNAFTVEKVLTRYPRLASIRDFGTVIGNPWKDRFFTLLGRREHLDGIEHGLLRAAGVFDEPRVHVAVNCASIGCPMLGERALVATRLDEQLETLMRRFMADRTRNRYDPASGTLELSPIFAWYGEDFRHGRTSFLGASGYADVADVGERYADLLATQEAGRARLRAKAAPIRHLDYDWRLNDAR